MQRLVCCLAMVFWAGGEALHLNAFIQNGIDIGLPYAAQICPLVVIITLIVCMFLLIGLFTRCAAASLIVCALFSAFFFFAGAVNKVNVVIALLALSQFINLTISGAGNYSLDHLITRRRAAKNIRIPFR